MGTGLASWIMGPQLIGLIFLLMGLLQKARPPKKINNYYGYRTAAAMKSQETWDEANRYSAVYSIKMGVFLLVVGILITVLLHVAHLPQKAQFVIFFLSMLASGMGSGVAIMMATEKHLGKTFDGGKE